MYIRCWMIPRYMSTMYSVPSGAFERWTGRKRSSVEVTNSVLLYAFRPRRVVPSSLSWIRLTTVRRRLRDENVSVEFRGKSVASIDRRRAGGGECRQRSVLAQDAVLVGPVRAWCLPRRPHRVDVSLRVDDRFVAAARAHDVRIARVVGCGHQIDVQRRFVVVAVNASRVVLRRSPLAARQRRMHLELAILQAQIEIGARS